MNNTIEIDTFGKKLDNDLTISSEYFGKVIFSYTILNIKGNKFLRYKIGDNPEIFMVDYNIIEEKLTLHEYFRNCLKFLNVQLEELKKNYELKDLMEPNEKKLIQYFEELKENYSKNEQ